MSAYVIAEFLRSRRDNSTLIERQDFVQVLKIAAPEISDDEIECILDSAQGGGGTHIDYTEFLRWLYDEANSKPGAEESTNNFDSIHTSFRAEVVTPILNHIEEEEEDGEAGWQNEKADYDEANSRPDPEKNTHRLVVSSGASAHAEAATKKITKTQDTKRIESHRPTLNRQDSTSSTFSSAVQDLSREQLCLKALSLQYLSHDLMAEVKDADLDGRATVYDIEPKVIRPKGQHVYCPRDEKIGAAYVDCVQDGAGLATHMLSYTWGYAIEDIVCGLREFCSNANQEFESMYFWICVFCINQHRVMQAKAEGKTVPFATLRTEFGHRVKQITKVVALLSPWYDPVYTKRVWCDFEMFMAASNKACKVSITMPARERNHMQSTLLKSSGSLNKMWEALQNVRIQDADASVREDKEQILELIKAKFGYGKLNSVVAKEIQLWIVACCEKLMRERAYSDQLASNEGPAIIYRKIGDLYRQVGKPSKALECFSEAHRIHEAENTMETHEGALLLTSIGFVHGKNGDAHSALAQFVEAKRIRDNTKTMENPDGAELLRCLGAANRNSGNLKGAITYFDQAREMRQRTGTLNTAEGANLLRSSGVALTKTGELALARQAFVEAREIRDSLNMCCTPEYALLFTDLGDVEMTAGNIDTALNNYNNAKHVHEAIGTLATHDGLQLLRGLGLAQMALGDHAAARDTCRTRQQICEEMGLLRTQFEATLKVDLGDLKFAMDDLSGADLDYSEAWRIFDDIGSLATMQCARLLTKIGEVKDRLEDSESATELKRAAQLTSTFEIGSRPKCLLRTQSAPIEPITPSRHSVHLPLHRSASVSAVLQSSSTVSLLQRACSTLKEGKAPSRLSLKQFQQNP